MALLASVPLVPRYIRDANDARDLFSALAHAPLEACGFAYINPEWRLLATFQTDGTHPGMATVPMRQVVADAIAFDATALVMAHNHPSGDPTPSEADLAVTRRLKRVLDAIDVRLIDHLVLAGDRWASMQELGLL